MAWTIGAFSVSSDSSEEGYEFLRDSGQGWAVLNDAKNYGPKDFTDDDDNKYVATYSPDNSNFVIKEK